MAYIEAKNVSGGIKLHNNKNNLNDSSADTDKLKLLFVKRIPLWKRSIDIFGSLCGLIILSPLFLAISILIKMVSSPGPVLFRQQRIGSGGRPFNCFKFRTMHLNADTNIHKAYLNKLIGSCHSNLSPGDPMAKISNDSRVIKYGNFLRSAGLDELPQLINILRGDMSIVGPRPSIPYEVDQYPYWYRARFDVLPGLTGLWQVSGKNKLGFNEMIRLDIQYALKCSFLLDCKILLMTPYTIYVQIKEMQRNRNPLLPNKLTERR